MNVIKLKIKLEKIQLKKLILAERCDIKEMQSFLDNDSKENPKDKMIGFQSKKDVEEVPEGDDLEGDDLEGDEE